MPRYTVAGGSQNGRLECTVSRYCPFRLASSLSPAPQPLFPFLHTLFSIVYSLNPFFFSKSTPPPPPRRPVDADGSSPLPALLPVNQNANFISAQRRTGQGLWSLSFYTLLLAWQCQSPDDTLPPQGRPRLLLTDKSTCIVYVFGSSQLSPRISEL